MRTYDVIVVGSGVAGMSAALGLARTRDVLVVEHGDGSTRWAQGGVASAFGDDAAADHAADTCAAGGGLNDPDAVHRLVEEGPLRLAELIASGARFDQEPDGRYRRSREGGHHRRRIVHAGGDATGAEVWRALHAAADRAGLPRMSDRVLGLTTVRGQVSGIVTQNHGTVRARAVVLATGGLGHVYGTTTNPDGVTGDGLAFALMAGARTSGLEFVQFHPTTLAVGTAGQVPLLTEALRGNGAVLVDRYGAPIMAGVHPDADLAPRDVVASAVHAAMREQDSDHVWLDARAVVDVRRRYPTVTAACEAIGVDPARDLVPTRPAAHYLCGGVTTDGWGATTVPGLYAVGEVASTGVHGANRLASNSLLEGLVYGARVAAALTLELPAPRSGPEVALLPGHNAGSAATARGLMDVHAGILRDAHGLATASSRLAPLVEGDATARVAAAVVAAASARSESLGCHRRVPDLVGAVS